MNLKTASEYMNMTEKQVLILILNKILVAKIDIEKKDLDDYLNNFANRYYSVKQAAVYLNTDEQSIYTFIRLKKLKAEKKLTKNGEIGRNLPFRFKKCWLDTFLQQNIFEEKGNWIVVN